MAIKSIVLVVSALLMHSCQRPAQTTTIRQTIKDALRGHAGTFAVAFKDLSTGEEILINEREVFHAASTMKTPVMVEVFRQAEAGKLSLRDSIVVKNEFRSIVDGSPYSLSASDDSEPDLYRAIGQRRAVIALVRDMIVSSSNLATNIVIELVGAGNVMKTMKEIGANDIQVLRGVEDGKAFEKGMNNTTTAYDLMLIFEKIAREELVSPAACRTMTEILLDQNFNEIIPAGLPAGVRAAHKTGNITGVRHDSGIVLLPGGRKYVLVLLSKGLEDEQGAMKAMADVSRILYQHVAEK